MSLRSKAVLLTVAAALGGGLVITASPAAPAATGYCAKSKLVTKGSYWAELPVTSGGSTSCVMGSGATGSHVSALQHSLNICNNVDAGANDGIYGPQTRSAVRTVQSRAGISVDGTYGPQTRNVVKWRWYSDGGATCARL
ncbi:hypothetical protein GCM10010129_42150 [Streptomyces fumigatiscleroticus]|nr:hypothetical protein GCM10010129_42150 [Streptomyces fumigatiscleroticus]